MSYVDVSSNADRKQANISHLAKKREKNTK